MINQGALLAIDDSAIIEEDELRGFSRTLAQIEWLLTVLVLLYLKLPGAFVRNENTIYLALVFFVIFILTCHYLWLGRYNAKWKLAIETWTMIAFITLVLWNTGKIESPLVSLYFIVIITSATALGQKITLLEVGLISACFLLLMFYPAAATKPSMAQLTGPLNQLFLMWFVAYLVSMLSQETGLARKKINHLSQIDSLTGLWNMRMFSSLMRKEACRSFRYDRPFAIIMLDADNLKPVNDNHGHEAGSAMIKLVAESLQTTFRESDIIARFGGDEFVVLLPETTSVGAVIAAERVRRAIESTPLSTEAGEVRITVSAGVADFPSHGRKVDEIINKADKALYESKKNGKNQSTIYGQTVNSEQ